MPLVTLNQSNGRPRRSWMMFVDGENLTIRAQKLMEVHQSRLVAGPRHRADAFVWFREHPAAQSLTNAIDTAIHVEQFAVRAYYYTSVQGGDNDIQDVRKQLRAIGFTPRVFKRLKNTGRSKGVDISLATEMLSNAYRDNYEVAVLVAGDADYVPLVEEVQRLGKIVYVVAFEGSGLGLGPELRLAADEFFAFDDFFVRNSNRHSLTQQ